LTWHCKNVERALYLGHFQEARLRILDGIKKTKVTVKTMPSTSVRSRNAGWELIIETPTNPYPKVGLDKITY
jgi:hypothetical protein